MLVLAWNWPAIGDGAVAVAAVFAVLTAAAVPFFAYQRRPDLTLSEKDAKRHSYVEAGGVPHLRLFVENRAGRRVAQGARVVVEGYWPMSEGETASVSLSHPALGWPSSGVGEDEPPAVIIHSGSGRPIGLGEFVRAERDDEGVQVYMDSDQFPWFLRLSIHGFNIKEGRGFLAPGEWIIQLLVGADDGDARRYLVHVAWSGDSSLDSAAVLADALDRLHIDEV